VTGGAPQSGEPRAWRPCVGVMLVNRAGLVWVGRRIDTPDGWQMPQGGIDDGEDPRDAALRELEEETGTANAAIIGEARDWLTYDLPPALIGRVWQGRWRGQRQKWFACRFLGEDSEFDIDGVAHPEFDAWRWVALDEVVGLIVPFKRPVYAVLVDEFAALVRPEGE
jgi:putative (di)nucleoside polyphosphate hydrolase